MARYHVLLPIFLSIISNQYVDCLKCYACGTFPTSGVIEKLYSSSSQLTCPEPFESKTNIGESTCNGQCRKSVYKRDGKVFTARGCNPLCYPQDEGDLLKTYCCTTDYCNGSPNPLLGMSWSIVGLVTVIAVYVTMYYH